MKLNSFHVMPALPERLAGLQEVAYNLRWSWNHECDLFSRLDRDLWERTATTRCWCSAASRRSGSASARAGRQRSSRTSTASPPACATTSPGASSWYRKQHGPATSPLVAYFSAEFGLTECLPIYSGGLGVLAGDHLKSRQRPGLPAGRRRPALPAGLLPPVPERRRLAAGALPGQRLLQPAGAARATRPDGTPVRVERRPRRAAPCPSQVWRVAGRPRAALPARHQRPGEPAATAGHHRPALRRRHGDAHPAGDRARHRRRPRAARARARAARSAT